MASYLKLNLAPFKPKVETGMKIYLNKHAIRNILTIIVDGTALDSASESERLHRCALICDPHSDKLSIVSHVEAKPALIQAEIDASFSDDVPQDFAIELDAKFLQRVLEKMTSRKYIEIAIDKIQQTIDLYSVDIIHPDLISSEVSVTRLESRNTYSQNIRVLRDLVTYDFDIPPVTANGKELSTDDARMIKGAATLLAAQAADDNDYIALEMKDGRFSLYSTSFSIELSNPVTADEHCAVLNSNTFKTWQKILSLCVRYSREQRPKFEMRDDCIRLTTSGLSCQMCTSDIAHRPMLSDVLASQNKSLLPIDVAECVDALESVAVCTKKIDDIAHISVGEDVNNRIVIGVGTPSGSASSSMELSADVIESARTIDVKRQPLLAAVKLFNRDETLLMGGFGKNDDGITLVNADKTKQVLIHD